MGYHFALKSEKVIGVQTHEDSNPLSSRKQKNILEFLSLTQNSIHIHLR